MVSSVITALKAHVRPTGLDRELTIDQQWAASQWIQQFFVHDPKGVPQSWPVFKEILKQQFGDPDYAANKRRELLRLRQSACKDLQDFVTKFETLCA